MNVLDEFGCYLLAGAGGEGPATLMDEARCGEELGFGELMVITNGWDPAVLQRFREDSVVTSIPGASIARPRHSRSSTSPLCFLTSG